MGRDRGGGVCIEAHVATRLTWRRGIEAHLAIVAHGGGIETHVATRQPELERLEPGIRRKVLGHNRRRRLERRGVRLPLKPANNGPRKKF